MARQAFFRLRDRRRFRPQSRSTGKVLLLFLLAAVFVVAGASFLYLQRALPAMAQTAPNKHSFYLRSLNFVIPGISEISSLPAANGTGAREKQELHKLSLPGLHDPKFLMLAQIPYLGDPDITLQPLLTQPEGEANKPRIIVPAGTESPAAGQIIIYHTHTTEAFEPTAQAWFTEDLSLTVAQLGKELAQILEEKYGVPVVHDETIHDRDRSRAY